MNSIMKGVIVTIACVFLAMAFISFERGKQKDSPATGGVQKKVCVTDFTGQTVALEKPAQRIVCLLESALTGIYMLGAQEQVIGVNSYPYQPHIYPYYKALDPRLAARSIPDVGEGELVSLEKIVALQPDLAIVWAGYPSIIKNLQDRGIAVFAVQINSFADIYTELELLGRLTGKEERAAALTTASKKELETLQASLANRQDNHKPSCYFAWAESKLDAAGGTSTGTQLISIAGGESVTAAIRQEHVKLNIEKIMQWNPEVIISWYGAGVSPGKFLQDNQWQRIRAVQNQRVYQMPDAFSCDLWTLKYIYGVKCVAAYLHPQVIDTDLAKEKQRLFQLFYGSGGEKAANVII